MQEKIKESRTFLIDSGRLGEVETHLYGYAVTDSGDLYLDEIPESGKWAGVYCLIRRSGDVITIERDPHGAFPIYVYEGEDSFLLSDSFFLLAESVPGKLSPDLVGAADLLDAKEVMFTTGRTLANEIRILGPDDTVSIDVPQRALHVNHKPQKLFYRRMEDKEDFLRLDEWYFRWVRLFRNLTGRHLPVTTDLSGGVDTRILLSMLISGNIDVASCVLVRNHETPKLEKDNEDRQIAVSIASDLSIVLNSDEIITKSKEGSVPFDEIYKTVRHTTFGRIALQKFFRDRYEEPVYAIKGLGSLVKGSVGVTYEKEAPAGLPGNLFENDRDGGAEAVGKPARKMAYIKKLLHEQALIRQLISGYEGRIDQMAAVFFKKERMGNFDGAKVLDRLAGNQICICPFFDPAILEFDFNPHGDDRMFLSALILDRYVPDLLAYPVQGGRSFTEKTLREVHRLNEEHPVSIPEFSRITAGEEKPAVKKRSASKEDMKDYLDGICGSGEFRRAVKELGGEEAKKLPEKAALSRYRERRLNALLALYEFYLIIHKEPEKEEKR